MLSVVESMLHALSSATRALCTVASALSLIALIRARLQHIASIMIYMPAFLYALLVALAKLLYCGLDFCATILTLSKEE